MDPVTLTDSWEENTPCANTPLTILGLQEHVSRKRQLCKLQKKRTKIKSATFFGYFPLLLHWYSTSTLHSPAALVLQSTHRISNATVEMKKTNKTQKKLQHIHPPKETVKQHYKNTITNNSILKT